MIVMRKENAELKEELTETKKSCITLTHSLNRYDEEMKKVQLREASRQADTAQLRVAIQKSTDEIEKLRALLSNNLTDEIFQTYRNLYLNADQEKQNVEQRMRVIAKTVKELKKRLEQITSKDERTNLLNNIKKITE
jgi:chromosome segregation ATPase